MEIKIINVFYDRIDQQMMYLLSLMHIFEEKKKIKLKRGFVFERITSYIQVDSFFEDKLKYHSLTFTSQTIKHFYKKEFSFFSLKRRY